MKEKREHRSRFLYSLFFTLYSPYIFFLIIFISFIQPDPIPNNPRITVTKYGSAVRTKDSKMITAIFAISVLPIYLYNHLSTR